MILHRAEVLPMQYLDTVVLHHCIYIYTHTHDTTIFSICWVRI
jgi:hypothetical protein